MDLNILYADGKGQIRRPEVVFESFFVEPFYWIRILRHNILVLMKKIRGKFTYLI